MHLSSTTDIEAVVELIRREKPDIVMVDSIQTMNLSALNSSSGSVTQVRECTQLLINLAKSMEVPVFIVGHVNKDGAIAGPKVLEHMVDAVLYFEGERNLSYRILRAIKNRYGSTNEIGVFEMAGQRPATRWSTCSQAAAGRGRPLENVSGHLRGLRHGGHPAHPGRRSRPWSPRAVTPRRAGRATSGFDYNRAGAAAGRGARKSGAGLLFSARWTPDHQYAVGGLRLDEPAADLPVALALVSNLTDKPIPEDLIAFGEVGLAGELRAVNRVQYAHQGGAAAGL